MWNRSALLQRHLDDYYRSAYFNDYVKPERTDGILSVPTARATGAVGGPYQIRGSLVANRAYCPEHYVLIDVERARAAMPSEAKLRERFDLTPQQARVARLLAARKTTAEIAETLFISPHTVRRHVEQVLFKLDVSSRHDVRGVIRSA